MSDQPDYAHRVQHAFVKKIVGRRERLLIKSGKMPFDGVLNGVHCDHNERHFNVFFLFQPELDFKIGTGI